MKLFLSTIDPNAQALAREHGLGLEIAEFCTAWNMDAHFPETDELVREKISGIPERILHGPFNELFPCAIDPMARDLARYRYRQAVSLVQTYGAKKLVIHGGYNPRLYYPEWYREQSILFWKDFIQEVPEGLQIVLENVLEDKPEMLLEIIQEVDDPRLRMCLDIGHANAYSRVPVSHWIQVCAPCISHFHIHNNDGSQDSHSALTEGTIPMAETMAQMGRDCPNATATLELPDCAPAFEVIGKSE